MTSELKELIEIAKSYPGPDHFHEMVREIESTPLPDLPRSIRWGLTYELDQAARVWGAKVPPGVKDHDLMRMRLLAAYFTGEEETP